MITIIIDLHQLQQPVITALRADAVTQYVAVRQQIRRALDAHSTLDVYVTSPVLAHALADLAMYSGAVTWRNVDPAATFEHLFGERPSPPFDSELLAALEIDTLPQPPTSADPISWMLRHRLSPLFGSVLPPAGHEQLVLTWAIDTEAVPPMLHKLLKAQFARWAQVHPMYANLRVSHLRSDVQALLVRTALSRYHSAWISQQSWGSCARIELAGLEDAAMVALTSVQQSIVRYWKEHYAASARPAALIDSALVQVSGLTMPELDELELFLHNHPEELSAPLFERIQERFNHRAFQSRLVHIAKHLAPPTPAIPQIEWNVNQWLAWATHEYMPYFAWAVRSGASRAYQQECALSFSDWLYTCYPALLADEQSPVLTRQYRELRHVLEANPDAVVLWLIVDGLTWWQGNILVDACRERGLYPQAHTPAFAVLPSITSISKRALITGIPLPAYGSLSVADTGRLHFAANGIEAIVTYKFAEALASIEQPKQSQCVVLLSNMIDVLVHKLNEFSDGGGVRGILEELADKLGQVRALCERQGRQLYVMIGSDHGSTLLPSSALLQTLPAGTVIIDDPWVALPEGRERQLSSNRAATISDSTNLTDEERKHWYILDRERFQLGRHYIVPRGSAYIGRRPEGWIHGGLTPEEVIVPLIRLGTIQSYLLPIEVQINGQLQAHQQGTLEVVLRNLNQSVATNVRLQITGAETIEFTMLEAGNPSQVNIRFAVPPTSATQIDIEWVLHYQIRGSLQRQRGQQRLALRRLSSDNINFDDMLGN